MGKNDTESVTERPKDKFARTLTYLKKVIRFSKRIEFYITILTLVKNLLETLLIYLNYINT